MRFKIGEHSRQIACFFQHRAGRGSRLSPFHWQRYSPESFYLTPAGRKSAAQCVATQFCRLNKDLHLGAHLVVGRHIPPIVSAKDGDVFLVIVAPAGNQAICFYHPYFITRRACVANQCSTACIRHGRRLTIRLASCNPAPPAQQLLCSASSEVGLAE